MRAERLYREVRRAFEDFVVLRALQAEQQQTRAEMVSMKAEIISELRRLDARIDGLDRELRTAIDIRERLAALEARHRE